MSPVDPTLEVERDLLSAGAELVIGIDEVGRGALAGPVAVGAVGVGGACGDVPEGLRDSKLLSATRREQLAPLSREWAGCSAVGLAAAHEIDELGILPALGLAAVRALRELWASGIRFDDAVVLLDGSHDWLTPALPEPVRVVTRVKADQTCAAVAAASVLAKVHRDALMVAADERTPGYGWASNKGYGSAAHRAAIDELGASDEHRRTWLRTPALVQL